MSFKIDIISEDVKSHRQLLEAGFNPKHYEKNNRGLYVMDKIIQPANSFVANYVRWLEAMLLNLTSTAIDTGNTSRALTGYDSASSTNKMSMTSYTAGVTTGGIQVGTGTNATTITTYLIQTLIAHGNGAGQLAYSAVVCSGFAQSGNIATYQIDRLFTNNSGNSITINETTVVGRMNGTSTHHFLVERNVLGSPITIANAGTKTIVYKFTLTI